MKKYAIVVAGGKGLRMGSDTPKQFLPIGGKPVLMRTLERFREAEPEVRLILVLPASQQEYWCELCQKYAFTLPHTVVNGGETRFHSVLNGLHAISDTDADGALVAVHDGVRPFVSAEVIRRCFEAADRDGAVVPVVPVVETVRQIRKAGEAKAGDSTTESSSTEMGQGSDASVTVDRSAFRIVQTPQTFRLDLLRRAYEQPYREAFTDDASVVEALGHPIVLIDGNRENIKITTPFDLCVAEASMRQDG